MTDRPLVAVAHGSRGETSGAATEALLDRVRRLRPGLGVRLAFLDHGEPDLPAALAATGRAAVVVPLLLTPGFHSRVDIPEQLARSGAAGTAHSVQAAVLGPHPGLTTALERRLTEVGVTPGDPRTAVVLAAAGSADASTVESVHDLAQQWAARRPWLAVQAAFASAATPTVEEAVADLRERGADRVAVAAYLLFPGLFATRLSHSGADVVSGPLGDTPEAAEIVWQRYDEVVAGLPVLEAARR
jgi:sirohydrochlorin ferrochelatase